MSIKLIGAVLVFVGCGGFGFAMAGSHRREEETLRQLITALQWMEWELSFRLTPLPQLCDLAGNTVKGPVQYFFKELSKELQAQISPDASHCVNTVLEKTSGLAPSILYLLQELGSTFGRFDLPGQLHGIRGAVSQANSRLQELSVNRSSRLRSYQTLGICAGAALAILFL